MCMAHAQMIVLMHGDWLKEKQCERAKHAQFLNDNDNDTQRNPTSVNEGLALQA